MYFYFFLCVLYNYEFENINTNNKVILLLAVLIFSYVNTKNLIQKKLKNEKEKLKEGNDPPKKLSENDSLVDNLVNKTRKMLIFQSDNDADVDTMEDYLDAVKK